MIWTLYVIRCGDGTLYTGVTTDLARRIAMHERGVAAKYTRGRGPFEVVHIEEGLTIGDALRRERAIKKLPRSLKSSL
jgi:predicted GIY-YIG superfamily endonuclease